MFKDFRCVDYNNMSNAYDPTVKMEKANDKCFCQSENRDCNMKGCLLPPIYECPVERCVHRNIMHEVPHVCPINTKIINHHIYRHTYSPCYTCCEENEVCNIQEGNCNCFK